MAKSIAAIFRLPVTTVVVTHSRTLVPPGRVELSQSDEFFVELQSKLQHEPKSVAAVLAHEIAHIFLHRCVVRFTNEFENELLTDTTAAYVGFGPTILNAATEYGVHDPLGNLSGIENHHFGYLTLDEFGYIQAKRDYTFGTDATLAIEKGFPMSGLINGREQLGLETKARPYALPITQSVGRFVKRLVSGAEKGTRDKPETFQFACVCCSQKLRLPSLGKKLSARCPVCHSQHVCFT